MACGKVEAWDVIRSSGECHAQVLLIGFARSVLDAVEEGASRREAAERFDVSASSAVKWFQSWAKEGRRGPKPRGGSRSPLEGCADQILALVGEQPDGTLDELVAALRKRRLCGSRSALWRFLERHGISVKKSLRAAEQDRADVPRARRRWIRQQGLLDASSLVFIDETSVNTSMARLYGRCPRGERLIGRVPFGTWETLSLSGVQSDSGGGWYEDDLYHTAHQRYALGLCRDGPVFGLRPVGTQQRQDPGRVCALGRADRRDGRTRAGIGGRAGARRGRLQHGDRLRRRHARDRRRTAANVPDGIRRRHPRKS